MKDERVRRERERRVGETRLTSLIPLRALHSVRAVSRHFFSLHPTHLSSLGASPLVPRLSGVNGVSEVSVRHDARDEG